MSTTAEQTDPATATATAECSCGAKFTAVTTSPLRALSDFWAKHDHDAPTTTTVPVRAASTEGSDT